MTYATRDRGPELNRRGEEWSEFHRRDYPWSRKAVFIAAAAFLLWSLVIVPQGETADGLWGEGSYDAATGEYVFEHNPDPVFAWGLNLGYIAGYLLLLSPLLAYRYPVRILIPLRWRTRVHVGAGILVLVAAVAHAIVLFSVRAFESWPSGLASFFVLTAHGLAGARKTWFVARMGARRWRTLHVGSAWTGLAIGLMHSLAL